MIETTPDHPLTLNTTDEYAKALYTLVAKIPVPLVPLYAQTAVLGQNMVGGPAGSCVTACAQLVRGLGLWGMRAKPVAAFATVYKVDGDRLTTVAIVGKATGAPTVEDGEHGHGVTNGHMIVYAAEFKRYVDMTIAQAPPLMEAGQNNVSVMLPSVIPVEHEEALHHTQAAARNGGFAVAYHRTPQYTDLIYGIIGGDLAAAMDYAALALAHQALDVIRVLGRERNLRQLHSLYPTLGALLAGRKQLPALPTTPPPGVARYVTVTRKSADTEE